MTHRVFKTVLGGLVAALVLASCASGVEEIPRGQPLDPNRAVAPGTVKIVDILNWPGRSWNYIEIEVGTVPRATSYQAELMFKATSGHSKYDRAWTEDWTELPATYHRWTGEEKVAGNTKTVPGVTHLYVTPAGTISLRVRAMADGEWTEWKIDTMRVGYRPS